MSNPDRTYLGFVKAASRKRLRVMMDFGLGHATADHRWNGEVSVGPLTIEPSLDVHRPNLYFERLFDRTDPNWLGARTYVSIRRRGLQNLQQGRFFLPHKKCAYLFDCSEDTNDYERSYCVLLEQEGRTIHGMIFIRQCCPSGTPMDAWVLDPCTFEFSLDGSCDVELSPVQNGISTEVLRMLEGRVMFMVSDVIVATTLINDPAAIVNLEQHRSNSLKLYNRMQNRRKPRLDAPIVMTLDRTRSAQLSGRLGFSTGQSKAGHERRAHFRILWRGTPKEKEIKVKAAAVKGGKPTQQYKVVR